MKTSKSSQNLARDLNLSPAENAVMNLKSSLYIKASKAILKSNFTHEEIAKKIGTSRARITRIANLGENSLSIELLIKIIFVLENKNPLKVA